MRVDFASGILAGLQPNSVWIEHSTTDFENTLKIRSEVEKRGAQAVAAPLTGGMQILKVGKMVSLVGADEDTFKRVAWQVELRYHVNLKSFKDTVLNHLDKST